MVAIIFKGQFETENQDIFISKLQEIMKETDTEYIGRVDAYVMPQFAEYQEIDTTADEDVSDKSEESSDSSDSDSNI